jgi:2-polyprenyl-6-methoxyphenol hydroxylase-like FAD-dependent oxidoreductase
MIVGAGPTGLVLAIELQRKGVPYRIIDQKEGTSQHSKALAYWPRTLECFRWFNLDKEVIMEGNIIHRFSTYFKHQQMTTAELTHVSSPYPFGVILSQAKLEALLFKKLEELGGQVEWNSTFTAAQMIDGSVECSMINQEGQKESVETSYLVGCDGAKSAVRDFLELPFKAVPYPDSFVLCDANYDWPFPEDEVQAHLHGDGVLMFFPFGKGRGRVLYSRAPNMSKPTKEDVEKVVAKRTGVSIHLKDVEWVSAFGIQHFLSPHFRNGSIFLAGDAAHIHSPAGGQGANTGMQDACNLSWRLSALFHRQANESILATYEEERHKVAKEVVAFSDRLTKAVEHLGSRSILPSFFVRSLMRFGLGTLLKSKRIQKLWSNKIGEISVNYRGTSGVSDYRDSSSATLHDKVMPGDLAPNALLDSGLSLIDLVGNAHYTLLLISPTQEVGALTSEAESFCLAYPDLFNFVVIDSTEQSSVKEIYGVPDNAKGLFLIRPDRYIAYRSNTFDFDHLKSHLSTYLLPSYQTA